jgi:hypothetical protein
MLSDHRRQALDEYFTRLLAELDVDVDEELSQLAVQETLDFESKLLDVGCIIGRVFCQSGVFD